MTTSCNKPILAFQGEYRFLSNFWHALVAAHWYGSPGEAVTVPTVEHGYQAMKAARLEDFVKICSVGAPGEAKRLGRTVLLRPRWEELKLPIMRGLVLQKFDHDADLRMKLLATGDRELVEGNHWGDTFWGVCRGSGENHLGKILMAVREQLR